MTGRRARHPARTVLLAVAGLLLVPVVLLGAVADGAAGLPGPASASPLARTDIPPGMLTLYQQAAAGCPGLGWPVLAGVGKVESDHNRPPGQVSSAGALGPMQFLPATWREYGRDGNQDGTANPFDPADAVPAAADYLCRHGAATDTATAVASYLCGQQPACQRQAQQPGGYASRVLAWARRYSDPTGPSGPAGTVAVQTALSQLGTPYRWGGDSPTGGFDCSGLVRYAYQRAGLTLPRTAQQQYDTGPQLPAGSPAQPGDLVFFGPNPTQVEHVGIALGQGRMVDAPHASAQVRVEPIVGFGQLLGTTRPAPVATAATGTPTTGTPTTGISATAAAVFGPDAGAGRGAGGTPGGARW